MSKGLLFEGVAGSSWVGAKGAAGKLAWVGGIEKPYYTGRKGTFLIIMNKCPTHICAFIHNMP